MTLVKMKFKPNSKPLAEEAAKKLADQIKNPAWFTGGIGVKECPKNCYVVVVYIDKLIDEIRKTVPMSIDGIPIQLDEIGKVKPTK